MKTCPNCKSEQAADDVTACSQCGYLFDKSAAFSSDTPADDSLDFVVTEASEGSPEFVGGQDRFPDDGDDLGIESTSDLMEKEAQVNASSRAGGENRPEDDSGPIGLSSPPLPPQAADVGVGDTGSALDTEPTAPGDEGSADRGKSLRKLSDEEVKSIEKNLYGSDPYLSDKEKDELIKKIDDIEQPFGGTPIVPPKHDGADKPASLAEKPGLPKPAMAKKGKGIAYFYRSYIQLVGSQDLFDGDELTVSNHEYVLRPKKVKPAYVVGAGALLFALLLFAIGSQFISDTGGGKGSIVGVVLDEYDRPYLQGATVDFSELGKSVKSSPQGFFQVDGIPAGTHKIEYRVGGEVIKVDYATIVGSKVSTVLLRSRSEDQRTDIEPEPVQAQLAPVEPPLEPEPVAVQKSSSSMKSTTKASKPAARKPKKRQGYAGITLAANVEGARLAVDGSVLGAGNLTYSKIKPGSHSYTVTLDGYDPVEGTIKLTAGENKKLAVTLAPTDKGRKLDTYAEDDFYYSGKNALREGDYKTAVEDFTEVINKHPSDADAYCYRGDAYTALKKLKNASQDYVRAAEIYQIKKNYNQAVTCYNKAVNTDKKSVAAYLGRANVYLSKGEAIAALADYKQVLKLDKRNFQAYYGSGQARFKQGQYEKAIKHFKDARSIDEKNPLVHQYLMLSYLAVNDYKKVKKAFEKFAKIATEEQMNRFVADKKYSAVLRIVETN